ncbi:MAG: hypothetical protein R3E12_13725 [Candidatus Eisenbacteria bacterium]
MSGLAPRDLELPYKFDYVEVLQEGRDLIAVEAANYSQCTVRRFDLTDDRIPELDRIALHGHANHARITPSPDERGTWLWVTGRAHEEDRLVSRARGVSENLHYLMCFDITHGAWGFWPPPASPPIVDTGLVALEPEIHLVLRGFKFSSGKVDWVTPDPVIVNRVVGPTGNAFEALLGNNVTLMLRWDGAEAIHGSATWSPSTLLNTELEKRAQRQGAAIDDLVAAFFADSVATLVASHGDVIDHGEFRDARDLYNIP